MPNPASLDVPVENDSVFGDTELAAKEAAPHSAGVEVPSEHARGQNHDEAVAGVKRRVRGKSNSSPGCGAGSNSLARENETRRTLLYQER